MDSAGIFGKTTNLDFLPDGIPISGVLGDQQAALAGQACFEKGLAKCTYGTGAFLLINIGEQPSEAAAGTLCSIAWQLAGKRTYAFEGSAFIAGAAIQFLRDNFNFLTSASQSESEAAQAIAAPELYFVPAFTGLEHRGGHLRREGHWAHTRNEQPRLFGGARRIALLRSITSMQQSFQEKSHPYGLTEVHQQ